MSDEVESTGALSRSLLLCVAVVLTYVVVGAVAGVVWEWLWSPPHQVVQQHQLYYTDYGSLRRVFTGTGLYVLVATVASALMALAAALLTRRNELLMLAAVVLGSLAAAYTMHAVGVALGPADPSKLAAVAADGTQVSGAARGARQDPLPGLADGVAVRAVAGVLRLAGPGSRRDDSDQAVEAGPATVELPSGRQQLLEQIRSARFTPVRLREGYEMGAVDGVLDGAAAAVTRGEPLAPVLDVPLPTVRWREGYDMAEVTAFFDGLRVSPDGADPHQ